MKNRMTADELRKSIYQLAIQGKLVKQDPNDEPASILLERIKAEKEKLIKEGKIKRDKNESTIFKGDDNRYYEKIGEKVENISDQIPFPIPTSWVFSNINSVTTYGSTNYNKPPMIGDWLVELEDIESKTSRILNVKKVTLNTNLSSKTTFKKNMILYSKLRPYLDKVIIAHENGTATSEIVPFYSLINNKYLICYLKSPLFLDRVTNLMFGVKMPRLSMNDMIKSLIPLPPLSEQQRIVDEINKLEPLIDEYSKYEQELTLLEEQFSDKFKKSILQYAIQGKLVKQDPNDEPASILLERIKAEKEKLIKEGKIKRDKNESYIYQGDDKNYYEKIDDKDIILRQLFPVPFSWNFTRISKVFEIARGGSPRPIESYLTKNEDGYNWIKISDTNGDSKYIISSKEKIKPEGLNRTRMVFSGDFLLTNSMSFGHPYILKIDGCIHDGWLVLSDRFHVFDKVFLYYLLSSPHVYKMFCENVGGSVVKNLNISKVSETIIPLPPMRTQLRIAKKLTDIFKIISNYSIILVS